MSAEVVNPFPNDPVNAGIDPKAGSALLYRQATGFERALADVDAQRLTAVYAELVRDQWDPDRISGRNLAYLAWAVGCNLWEADWDETFRRWWVKNQWTLKAQRGSALGLKRFVAAVKAETRRLIVPPASTYLLRSDTDAERAAYVARFPQLRVYPYVARETLPWLCYAGGRRVDGEGHRVWHKNGSFLGPLRPAFPTVQNQGGNYTRTAALWDRGVETTLTVRKIARVRGGEGAGWGFTPGVSAYDEQVVLPLEERLCLLRPARYLGAGAKRGVFPNEEPALRTVTIARSGPLELTQGKAQYQTVAPDVELLKLEPELVKEHHQARPAELYASRRQYLCGKFLPRSNAWRHVYERWYVFDADRVPEYRRKGVYLNHTRLGIDKFTAEVMVRIRVKRPRFLAHDSGWVYGFLGERNNEPINKVRRAVTASMALRDTVLIDTKTVRTLQVGDIIDASGRFAVGQLVPA